MGCHVNRRVLHHQGSALLIKKAAFAVETTTPGAAGSVEQSARACLRPLLSTKPDGRLALVLGI